MRIKRPPPASQHFELPSLTLLADPQVETALQKARARHWHYDRFRHAILPPGVSREMLWNYVRLQRSLELQKLPLRDEKGTPFRVCVPPDAGRLLSQIDRQTGGAILSDTPDLPSREQFVVSSLMEEAISSSLLEGAQTTRVLAKQMLRDGRSPRTKAERMVKNNWLAMERIVALKDEAPSRELLLELHALMTRATLDDEADCGRLRRRDDIAVVDAYGEVAHQPPRAALLPDRLDALFDWVNDESEWIHPVVKASLLHFFIGYEHPFVDGNGRTARALFYHFMLSRGYWLFEYLSISRFFLRAPGQYGRAYLYVESDENDATYFVAHSLRVVELAILEMQNYLARKQRSAVAAREAVGELVLPAHLGVRQKALILHALQNPKAVYSFALHQNLHRVVYQTARTDLLDLEARGFLNRRQEGKKFVFTPALDLRERVKP